MIVSDVNLEWESEQAHSSLLERTGNSEAVVQEERQR